MRFSANGYYIERYVKCANCGMLVYGDGIAGKRHGKACVYCSAMVHRVGDADPIARLAISLPIVQPRLPIEDTYRRACASASPTR